MADSHDLIVVGGGPAGLSAAVTAARGGCRVLLVERYGFAGGMATAALVNPFAGNCCVNPETGRAGDIIAGFFGELLDRLRARGATERFCFSLAGPRYYDAFDETQLRVVYDEVLAEAGVTVLFHAWFLDAAVSGGRIESICVQTKGGAETLRADNFIDSTGDGDLAAAASVPFDVGRPEDGLCQPCSMMFRMGGVDKGPLLAGGLDHARRFVTEYFERARQAGRLEFPFRSFVHFYDYPRPGALHFNMTRVWRVSGLSSWDLSAAEVEGRRQAKVFCDWVRSEVPHFKGAFLETVGPQIGVRETRRIRGRYQLSGDDVRAGARFPDGIARSGYFIDIHSPTGGVDAHAQPGADVAARRRFIPQRYYEIPFRCLAPQSVENLLVACRAISTDFAAHAATRVMATMHAVGQAAGHAAAIARSDRVPIGSVPGPAVRSAIGGLDQPLSF